MLTDPDRIQGNPDNDRRGDAHAQLDRAWDALEHARTFARERLPHALVACAQLLVRDEQYDEACKLALEILEIDYQSTACVEASIIVGICSARTNRLADAEQHFNQAADLSRKLGYLPGLADALQLLSSQVLLVQGKFQLALSLLDEAHYLREEQGGRHWSEIYLTGLINQITGNRQRCRQALDDLVLRVEPGTNQAAAYYFLWARLALDDEELEQAKEYLRLGLRVVNKIGSLEQNLLFRLEHSRYYRMKNEPPVARSWAEDSLHQARQQDMKYYAGLALIERAQSNWSSGAVEAAMSDLKEAAAELHPLKAEFDLTRIDYLRALWLQQSGHEEAPAAWLQIAHQIIHGGYAFILEKEQAAAFPLVAAHMRSKNVQLRSTTETLLRHLAHVPPPPLRVVTLGQFAVWKGRRRLPDQTWNRRKAGELLRYLLLQVNRCAGREIIIESLWPDHDSGSPADLLHQATSALRHALEPDLPDKFPSRYLRVEGEQLMLMLPAGSAVDFDQFERTLPAAIQMQSVERLQEALNLYSGELFPSDRYADWSEEKRQALADLRQRGMLALAKAYLDQGQLYNTINCCRQILHADSWNEDAVWIAMQAYRRLQNVPHALQIYQELERTLKQDLNTLPRSDLRELAQSLRQR